jgi:uncharacterized protein YndB with AHSA1/START domain
MSTIAAVRKTVEIQAPIEHVFKVFTHGVDRWWPRQHHIGASPLKQAVIEPHIGGRWYSICEDGSECDIGRVLAWTPPTHLILSWQITADWTFDPSFVTEVEVTFTSTSPKSTSVVMEHRDLERYGDAAVKLRQSIDSPEGWGFIMASFAKVAGEPAP